MKKLTVAVKKHVDNIGIALTGVAVAGVAIHAVATKERKKDDRMNTQEEKHD